MGEQEDRMITERDFLGEYPELLTVENLAKITGQHCNTIRALCLAGDFPAVKFGRRWYVPKTAITDACNSAICSWSDRKEGKRPKKKTKNKDQSKTKNLSKQDIEEAIMSIPKDVLIGGSSEYWSSFKRDYYSGEKDQEDGNAS